MFHCTVCGSGECRNDTVDYVFKVEDEYALVNGVPAVVCRRCGERTFSRETTEKVRLLVHSDAEAPRSVPMRAYDFA